jgi:succinate-semialdehyde dehydrogenase/glutarate-semialdehyde dehydrogenase
MADELLSINPNTGTTIASYPINTPKQIQNSLLRAQKSFAVWSMSSFKERATVLKKIAAEIRLQKQKLALLATAEMGKPIAQSNAELDKCAATLDFYAKEGPRFLANELIATNASKSYVAYCPIGTVLAVMPWNFPYWQVFRALGPILMAGNTMVLKHASNVSGCALAMAALVKKATDNKGLLQTLIIPSAQVQDIVAHPSIAAVTFTGSTTAGSKLAAVAGAYLKKQVLELGGSDAYVILADADLDHATDVCVRARLVNTGQSCVAAKRFVVVKSIRKHFEALFVEKMSKATYGNPLDASNNIGPMARIDLRDELHAQVLKSITLGAKLKLGGFIPDGPGAFYPPTVLTNVKKGMPAYHDELFGPVAAIIEAKDENDAMKIANDSIYGLGGAIFSRQIKNAERLAAQVLQAGNCFVNDQVHSDAAMPFGGIKQSGYGRELGLFGIREFVNIKSVFIK